LGDGGHHAPETLTGTRFWFAQTLLGFALCSSFFLALQFSTILSCFA